MARKVLVPVFPAERFYDAVVAAADFIAEQGGQLTFLLTRVRPPMLVEEKSPHHHVTAEYEVPPEVGDPDDLEAWQDDMRSALADARDLLYERGLEDDQINVVFADFETPPAQAIADEAAAGGYDLVVLARGYWSEMPDFPFESGADVAEEVQALADEGIRLLVT